jgi:2-oxo-4-hydroxy-4-carboxy-5-ureidoimidazoline decarboxylase
VHPIDDLNQLEPRDFADALKPLFEAAAPLAEALYAERPFTSYDDLLARAESLAARLSTTEQIGVISAHPRIGESAEKLSALSYAEQGYDREAILPPDAVAGAYATLAKLNRAYEERFGFRFVVFVNGRPKSEIVGILQERLLNSRDQELQTALRDMFLIAHDRYSVLIAN